MTQQEKSFYISAKLNFFGLFLQVQYGSYFLIYSFDAPLFLMLLFVKYSF